MQVKICGLRNFKSASTAIENNSDFIGFVFVKGSKRQLKLPNDYQVFDQIRSKYPDMKTKIVGLFANQSKSEIEPIIKKASLDLAQICGDKEVGDLSIPTIRQLRIKPNDDTKRIYKKVKEAFTKHKYVLLDSFKENALGGTGTVFDWNKAKNVIGLPNVIVSGGLNNENLNSLKDAYSPFGVDVSSGVETNNEKDESKIFTFIKLSKQ